MRSTGINKSNQRNAICGVVFFTSPFHLGGRHARPFTRNLEGECIRDEMNFISVLPTISNELSYCPTGRKGKKRSQLNHKSLLSVRISPRLEILESGGRLYIGKCLSTLQKN